MNKNLGNKAEPIYRSAKERKNTKKHKRVTGYPKNMANPKSQQS
jgi:hypothetical protein